MVKLIRLASDNNAIFKSNFQNDIIIEPQSQIALVNATFNVDFDNLNITQKNSVVTVTTDTSDALTIGTHELENVSYSNSASGSARLLKNINQTLNACLDGSFATSDTTNNSGSQMNIRNLSSKKRIEYRYAPFLNPLFLPSKSAAEGEPIFDFENSKTDITTNGTSYITTIKKVQGEPATLDRSNNLITGAAKLCSGNALLTCRIANSVTNLSGAEDNGFGIGLTKKDLSSVMNAGEEIPSADRGFEIRYNRPAEPFVFLKPGDALETNTNITSSLVLGGNIYEHDFVYFELNGGILEGGVCQVNNLGYLNLPEGNDYTQSPTPATERFDEVDLGEVATYRRVQVGTGTIHWWEATSATDWNVYFTGPPVFGQVRDTIATAVLATGVLSIGGNTFTPSSVPSVVTGVPTKKIFFKEPLNEDEQELYPYIYLRGGSQHIGLDMFNYTLDPWINQDFNENADDDQDGAYWEVTGLNSPSNIHNAFQNGFQDVFDNVWINADAPNDLYIPNEKRWIEPAKTYSIKMHKDVWRFLGFKNLDIDAFGKAVITGKIGSSEQNQCWSVFQAPSKFGTGLNDNFIVESNSIPLDSYDASQVSYSNRSINAYTNPESDKQGRRKNVLMTIPVNDNESGLVEFETNTPIFIDINNANTLNQKSLNFKILDLNFDEIKTSGAASILTLLIKGPSE